MKQVEKRKLIVVIRTVGERTFGACRSLVMKQIPANAVEVVNERPFEKALKATSWWQLPVGPGTSLYFEGDENGRTLNFSISTTFSYQSRYV